MRRKCQVSVFLRLPYLLGFLTLVINTTLGSASSSKLADFIDSDQETWKNKIPVIYDSSGVDGELQSELAKSALLVLRVLENNELQPLFLDLSKFDSMTKIQAIQKCAKILIVNELKVIVSLLNGEELRKFAIAYDDKAGNIQESSGKSKLYIYTPRSYISTWKMPYSVIIKSLQMSEEARAVALLNRVGKVGVRTLIPILDGDIPSQFELLKAYYNIGKESKQIIKFTKPILLNDPVHAENFKKILQEHTGFHDGYLRPYNSDNLIIGKNQTVKDLSPGVLVLATKGSQLAMKIAADKNHLLLSWFSPNILEYEEWACKQSKLSNNRDGQEVNQISVSETGYNDAGQHTNSFQGTAANNNFFGLYTVNFVGSKGWDNPLRRRMLRELTAFTGASPRILAAVLTYDATWLARDHLRNEMKLPKQGLSGLINFNNEGFRKDGTYLGSSSVPTTVSSSVTLLQPSTWILEDIISLSENIGGVPEITDYDIATSSILTNEELLRIANSTRNEVGCQEHMMSVVTYDPFNQLPYHYFFSETRLPDSIVVPNHQGFGITFACTHFSNENYTSHNVTENKEDASVVSTLQLACTPGLRMNHPISCFRSHINRRQKRETSDAANAVPNVQYQYSFSSKDPWNSQSPQWTGNKDKDASSQYYYNQPIGNRDYQVDAVTYGRLDVPISEEPSSTPAAPPASKLPELRQILKAAKPFVGSCIGSSTGCAMCVLVLGRLPLGALPAACTGPCFVGTFGSCGSLLGRVFSETTVICTELFKQGLLDTETFVADAEFGKLMADTSPYTMQGYTLLATPLVDVMKSSKFVTNIVATFALPWAHHMKYLLGRSDDTNLTGRLVHLIGYPTCNIVGRAYFIYAHFKDYCITYSLILVSPLMSFLITLAITIMLIPNLGFSTSTQRYNIFQTAVILFILTSKSKKILQRGVNYLKAIGRRT